MSPTGSAAASSRSRLVSPGRASKRRRKLCSIRLARGTTPGSPKPPASSAGVNLCGSSSSANGLPRVSATTRSRTCWSSGPRIAESSTAPASSLLKPPTDRSGRPARSCAPPFTHSEHQSDRLRHQAAGDKAKGLGGSSVLPLRVIDHAHERTFRRYLRQQSEDGQTDQETIGGLACAQPEGGRERVPLRAG